MQVQPTVCLLSTEVELIVFLEWLWFYIYKWFDLYLFYSRMGIWVHFYVDTCYINLYLPPLTASLPVSPAVSW